jgi:thiol-disulfide isomerase/thioredoxin
MPGPSSSLPVRAAAAVSQFDLRGVDGKHHSLPSLAGSKATVVIFISNGCPTVRSYEERLIALQETWRSQGVKVIGINANNPFLSPPDTFEEMVKRARDRNYNFPYLKDDDRVVAKSFGAVCTPHAFALDRDLRVAYSGRIDDSRVGDTITSRDLENAVADIVAGRPVTVDHTDPFGCSIVW